jgi:TonB family protein
MKVVYLLCVLTTLLTADAQWLPQHVTSGSYPSLAGAARIEGTVMLSCSISDNGSVRSCAAEGGHPLLREAAIRNVKDWTFKSSSDSRPPSRNARIRYHFKLAPEMTERRECPSFSFDFPDAATLEIHPPRIDHRPDSGLVRQKQ